MALWFKNLLYYRLDQEWTLPPGGLEAHLAQRPLQPCTAMSLQSNGWVPPLEDGALVRDFERHLLVALGMEQKLLPGSVVNDLAREKAAAFERSRGFKPGRKMMRDFKEQATSELLPRAFARRRQALAWIDPVARRLVVEGSSPARAEIVVEELRAAIGELPVALPETDPSARVTLTAWLAGGRAPAPFTIEDECELTGSAQTKPVVRYLRHALDQPHIERHLQAGMQVSRLALSWNARISFVVNDKLQLRRVRFLDMAEAGAEEPARADAFEVAFALMSGELGALLSDLEQALRVGPRAA